MTSCRFHRWQDRSRSWVWRARGCSCSFMQVTHCQSQTTLWKAFAWAKNVFQKRALEKHMLAGDCGHIFLMFPLLIFSPSRAPAAVEGLEMSGYHRSDIAAINVSYILQQQQSGGPYSCRVMAFLGFADHKFGRIWSQTPGFPQPPGESCPGGERCGLPG